MSKILRTHTPLGALLKARGLGVVQTAKGANVPRQHMAEYLAGARQVRPIHLQRLSAYLGVDRDILVTPLETIDASLEQLGRTRNWDHS
jgi:transcriptional regulator with XRE-family HTH domain